MRKIENLFWTYYLQDEVCLSDEKCGKWMYFFRSSSDLERVSHLCMDAVREGIVQKSKHTNFSSFGLNPNGESDSGVCCFYLEADDFEGHKKIIKYFLDNQMIQKTKSGRYYNISYKLDDQTRAGEYGSDFKGTIKLDQFIDLNSGKFIK